MVTESDRTDSCLEAEDAEHPNNTRENAEKYLRAGFENTYYLGYRDIRSLLNKYVMGKKAIDYGCGTGRSTRYLKSLGFEVIGVDVSKEMLKQAQAHDEVLHYLQIRSGQIPVLDGSYDLAFCCFVLFTISSKSDLLAIFKEIYRCLKVGGVFIAVTGSEELYKHDWISYDVRYPENEILTSGKSVKIRLKDLGVEFINYFWADEDYCELFNLAGLQVVEKHFPLASIDDGANWISETQHPPYVIYVLKKPG